MPALMAILLMQYVVSVKAGLVNHVQGTANVAEMEMARPQSPIRTGHDGYVEVLLSPGSFLRLGGDSEAVINDENLDNLKVTIVRGPAVIEVVEIRAKYPITITTGNLTTKIIDTGIYRFQDGTATVLQGKLQTHDSKFTYEKGWQVFFKDNYRARKTGEVQVTNLDLYSRVRSEEIAEANFSLASSINASSPLSTSMSMHNAWLFAPFIGMYTFIPQHGFRSPYGFRYYGLGATRVVRQPSYSGSNETGGGNGTAAPPRDNGNNAGNNGGGAGGTASAPTAATPSGERTSPATYIEGKNTPTGATSR